MRFRIWNIGNIRTWALKSVTSELEGLIPLGNLRRRCKKTLRWIEPKRETGFSWLNVESFCECNIRPGFLSICLFIPVNIS